MFVENIPFTSKEELLSAIEAKKLEDSPRLLIQVFCAVAQSEFIEQIQEVFQDRFVESKLIGVTTDGVIDGAKVYDEAKSVATFTYFERTTVKTAIVVDTECEDSYTSGYKLMQALHEEDLQAVIAFSDGICTNGEEFLGGCSDFDKNVLISGGMAADGGKLVETFVFDKHTLSNHGAVGAALISKDLYVANHYSFDWLPVGKKMTVTKSIKNRVYEVDGERAVDIYAKYLGHDIAKRLPKIGIELPFIFEKNGIVVGRAVLAKHGDGSLTFAGNIDEGTTVRFGVGNVEMIISNSSYHVQKLLIDLHHQPEAIFIYSCMARRRFLAEALVSEIQSLSKLGKTAGFFTYGEFFHSQGRNELLNETMTILALSENKKDVSIESESVEIEEQYEFSTEHALAYLANKISDELSELNQHLEEKIAQNARFIYKQAYYDRLTQLPNRLSLINDIKERVDETIFLVNVDDFSSINDFYGHIVGDTVLQKVAEILKKGCKKENKIYKLPSDEFVIISPLENRYTVIEKLIHKVIDLIEEQEFIVDGLRIHISVTIGASYINEAGTGLRNADMALKQAKRTNKKFLIFKEDLKLAKQYEENIQKVHLIKNALHNDGIVPYFQPIIDIKTQKVHKYEALVRIITQDGEVISPANFLEASQKLKFYEEIMKRMIKKSFEYAKAKGVNFSINLSYDDITDDEFKAYLFGMIKDYDVASLLTIEILETQAIDYETNVQSFVEEIYNLGAKVAIDDFGSGYANFKHITKIKCDYLKIDGSLIRDIDTHVESRLIVETIIVFAKKLGKKTVAEFVHSQKVFDMVKELGIDYAQGFFLGKPQREIER